MQLVLHHEPLCWWVSPSSPPSSHTPWR